MMRVRVQFGPFLSDTNRIINYVCMYGLIKARCRITCGVSETLTLKFHHLSSFPLADSALPLSKHPNRCGGANDGEDRINGLQDEILSHILSFLPTKHAVLTSILSKRWRYLWTWAPHLDFDDSLRFLPCSPRDDSTSICFMNFVNRVLILRNNHSAPIQTFRLKCHHEYSSSLINTWICSAVESSGVRELDLGCLDFPGEYVHLPRNLLSCQKLEVLKLTQFFVIYFPDSISLFNLRVLHLVMVKYVSVSRVQELICSCPVLEELVIERECFDNLEILAIRSGSLKSLKLHAYMEYPEDPEDECRVIIDAPNLEHFDLGHILSGAFEMCRFPSLVKANVDIVEFFVEHSDITDVHKNNLDGLLTSISNVQHLSLSSSAMNSLDLAVEISMPKFHNLTRLEVKIKKYGWRILPELLKCAPFLKEFVFVKEYKKVMKHLWYFPDSKPKCLPMLEILEFKGFEGCQAEIELATYFLESAMVLRKMTIYTHDMGFKEELTVLDTLTRSPNCSEICEIVLKHA